MYKRRVIVVDDLPDVRATLSGLLSDEGYDVRSVSSRTEALRVLETERFHIAVLDVRLDESGEDNREGLQLMYEMRQRDPSIAVIILTAYADIKMVQETLQTDSNGISPAFGFLQKTEMDQLPQYVRRAFGERLKINIDLQIQDAEQFLALLPKQIRFVNIPKPPREQLLEEADELLRKLFFGCERIEVRPMQRGYSGVAVFQVTPWYRGRGHGETVVAKVGEHFLVENENKNYQDLVQGLVGGHRLPKTLEIARTRTLSGVLYTFVGLGHSRDFVAFYRAADVAAITPVIENLFLETCFPWRRGAGIVHPKEDLRTVYMSLQHLTPEKLQMCLDNTIGGRHPFRRDKDERYLWLQDKVRILDPVTFALSGNLKSDSYTTIIHGDLQGYNVLVDRHNETWLIDFASTCKGPLLQDYASFETFLRISMVECTDWDRLYEWAGAMFHASDLRKPSLPDSVKGIPDIEKAHQTILTVRKLAFQEPAVEIEREYLVGLLFNALKIVTIMNLAPAQRDHALISAALIAERLQTIT
jgi:CheY-like chemotaxis protein